MPEIKVENLKVSYTNKKKEDITVLNELNVTFKEGEFSVVLGSSGCGKTTLLRTLIGLIEYEGNVYYDNEDVLGIPIVQRNLAFVSQQYVLYPHLSVFDNIAFPLKLLKAPKDEIIERVNFVASKLGIEYLLSRKPKQLSGGQQQRVALARALVKRPSVIYLDEPLSNLDYQARVESRHLIKKVTKELGITVIYVTHDFKEALAMADTIYVMNNLGKIEISGSPKEIYDSDNEFVNYLKHDMELENTDNFLKND